MAELRDMEVISKKEYLASIDERIYLGRIALLGEDIWQMNINSRHPTKAVTFPIKFDTRLSQGNTRIGISILDQDLKETQTVYGAIKEDFFNAEDKFAALIEDREWRLFSGYVLPYKTPNLEMTFDEGRIAA